MLTELTLRYFRSLRSTRLELKPLTLIIGPNASGKSNLIKALRFIHDAVAGDILDWQSYDSQVDDLLWFGVDDFGERPTEIEIAASFDNLPPPESRLTYGATFSARRYLEVQSERLAPARLAAAPTEPWVDRQGSRILRHVGMNGIPLRKAKTETARSMRNLTLRDEGPSAAIPGFGPVYRHISGWRFFDIDPKSARRPHFVPEFPEEIPSLAADGSNLSAFLYSLWRLRNSDLDAVTEIITRSIELPQKIQVEHDADRGGNQASFYFYETFFGENRRVRPESLSDGTIRLLGLMALLLADENVTLACLEEPDSGLHPRLMSYLADALRQAVQEDSPTTGDNRRLQVVAVTHSPELMDCFDLAAETDYVQVYVAERGEDGESRLIPVTAQQFAPWLEKYRLGDAVRRHFL
jgi:predicted ATPase